MFDLSPENEGYRPGAYTEGQMILVTNNEGTAGAPTTARMLAEGAHALDAIEAGIRLIEADPSVRTVGRGGWPNLVGDMELDASVMDGTTLRTGAVGALQGFLHPISVARAIMHHLPHEFLVGDGAARFAREIGAEAADNLTEDSGRVWRKWFASEVTAEQKRAWPDTPLAALCRHAIDPEVGRDTTVFLARDSADNVCCGTSTSGWGWKYPGRLGDSPIIGAGSYADTRYGASACTGAGEMTIRCCTARSVVLYMKQGASVGDAVREAVNDMRALKGGLISRVTIHAIDADGNHKVVVVNGAGNNNRSNTDITRLTYDPLTIWLCDRRRVRAHGPDGGLGREERELRRLKHTVACKHNDYNRGALSRAGLSSPQAGARPLPVCRITVELPVPPLQLRHRR